MRQFRISCLTLFLSLAASPLMAQDAANMDDAPTEGAKSGGLPQFDPHWWPSQILWLAICFVVFYGILSTLILPAIGGTLETRRQRIQADLASAERLKNEAEVAHKAYESGLANARAEASGIISKLHEQLKAQAEAQARAFRENMEREMAALDARLVQAKEAAMKDMTTIAAEIASEAARKIVGISFDPQKAQNVVEALNRREAA